MTPSPPSGAGQAGAMGGAGASPDAAGFAPRLARNGLSKRAFARLIGVLSGRPPQYRTVERWGVDRDPPDAAWALLRALELHPGLAAPTPDQPAGITATS